MNNRITIFFLLLLLSFGSYGQTVFINEVSYLDDADPRGIEIANPNQINLQGWKVIFYTPDGTLEGEIPLQGDEENTPGPSDSQAADFIWVDVVVMMSLPGSGVGLVNKTGNLLQFISFGSNITPTEGEAVGYVSEDIGVQSLASNSLQLTGEGSQYIDFDWSIPTGTTPAALNTNQTFGSTSAFSNLPVEWLAFTATTQKTGILLSWTTATELDNRHFILERSNDGENFEVIEFVESQGSSTTSQSYQFLDYKAQKGINYYRISQEDFDGKISPYKIISAIFDVPSTLEVYPNPAVNDINITLPITAEKAQIQIFDTNGKLLLEQLQSATNGLIQMNVSALPQGYYSIWVNANGQRFSHVLLKH